jgi:anti-sigma regulatory factor (Ser/Thr protein kinase)
MCHSAEEFFAPEPEAAGKARSFVREDCAAAGLGDLCETAVLLTSELVTNGVLHARTQIGVVVRLTRSMLRIDVRDHDPRPPVQRSRRNDLLADIDEVLTRDPGGEHDERHTVMSVGPAGSIGAGRGLLLIEALADEWGVEQYAEGKSVWFSLLAPDEWVATCDGGCETAAAG